MRRNGWLGFGVAACAGLAAFATGCAPEDGLWLDQLVDRAPGFGTGATLDDGVLRGDGLVMLGADARGAGALIERDGYTLESSDPRVIDLARRGDLARGDEPSLDDGDGLGPDAPAVWLDTPGDASAEGDADPADPAVVVVLRTGEAGDAVLSLVDPDGVTIDTIDVSVATPRAIGLAPGGAAWWRGLDELAPRTLAGEDYSYDVVAFDGDGAPLRGMAQDVRRLVVPHPNRSVGPEAGEALGSNEVGVHEMVLDGVTVRYEVVDPADVVELRFRAADLRPVFASDGVDRSAGLIVVGVDRHGRDVLGVPARWGGAEDLGDLYEYTPDAAGDLVTVDASWNGLAIADAVRQSGAAVIGHSDQAPGCDATGGAAGWTGVLGAAGALAVACRRRRTPPSPAGERRGPRTNTAACSRVTGLVGQ